MKKTAPERQTNDTKTSKKKAYIVVAIDLLVVTIVFCFTPLASITMAGILAASPAYQSTPIIRDRSTLTFCDYAEPFCEALPRFVDSPAQLGIIALLCTISFGGLIVFIIMISSYLSRRTEYRKALQKVDELRQENKAIKQNLKQLRKKMEQS